MTLQDEMNFNKFLDMLEKNGDTQWQQEDMDDYPECQHPPLEDIL